MNSFRKVSSALFVALVLVGLTPSAFAESFLLGPGAAPVFRAGILGSLAFQSHLPPSPYLNRLYQEQHEAWGQCFDAHRRRERRLRAEEVAEDRALMREGILPPPIPPIPPVAPYIPPVFQNPELPVAAFGVAPGFNEQIIDLQQVPPMPFPH
jgi:hypothetical protein